MDEPTAQKLLDALERQNLLLLGVARLLAMQIVVMAEPPPPSTYTGYEAYHEAPRQAGTMLQELWNYVDRDRFNAPRGGG